MLGIVVSIVILAPYYVIFEKAEDDHGVCLSVSASAYHSPKNSSSGFSSGYDRQEFQGCVA
jgi:hypothetical protein